jgi:hypothetical protein
MTDPDPTYHTNGEQLPAETVESLRREMLGARSDAISQVRRYERMLEALGHPVEPAIRPRPPRRRLTRIER